MSLGSKENSAQFCSDSSGTWRTEIPLLFIFYVCIFLSDLPRGFLLLHLSFRDRVQISLFIHHCSAWSHGLLNMKMNMLDMSPALCNAQLLKNKEQDIGECITLGHELSHPLYLNFNSFASQVGYLGWCFVCRLHLLCFLHTFIFLG